MDIKELSFLPTMPGCYLFKDKVGTVLYVGKAKNLRKRVLSYFQKKDHDPKTARLVPLIAAVDHIVTGTEVEALLLENNLIKRYYPKFNLDLKDSRRYAYLLLHTGDVPWIEVVRDRKEPGEYYGPFVSGAIRRLVLEVIRRNFRVFTRKPHPRLKKSLDREAYLKRVDQARAILRGDVDALIATLEQQMKEAAGKTYYEYALTVRNQINALESLKEKQNIEMTRSVDANIIAYKLVGDEIYMVLFTIRKGVLEEKQSFTFSYYEDFFEDFLLQYYDTAPIPQELIVQHPLDDSIIGYLIRKGNRMVIVTVPQRGEKKELLELAMHNITTTFFAGSERMTALQTALNLSKLPRAIECFDISHLTGTNTVASMVRFKDGLPDKDHYRRFKIHTASDGDDYRALFEVVTRRYGGSLRKTLKTPDLIVIDGGAGQLQAALQALRSLRLEIPCIALAKKFEEIYLPAQARVLVLDRKNKGLQLLQALRDEAHRFALGYQRHLRQRSLHTASFSDEIL